MTHTKRPIRTILACALLALATLCAPAYAADGGANLTADAMQYNPDTGEIHARGNVHLFRPDGELFGDEGRGNASGRDFEMRGDVHGTFARDGLEIVCAFIRLSSEGTDPVRRTIEASGDVVLTRSDDKISAHHLSWAMDYDNYTARGDVVGNFRFYHIDADEIARDGDDFSARAVRRYEDRERRMTLTANGVRGRLYGGRVAELIADGNVVMDSPDESGTMTRVTGNRAIFSVARGTIVVSGNANVVQQGRRLHAGSIVYHLDSGRIEALERPTLVIEVAE